jgi:6-phosphogluconolactonase (cycloisomerase 2 family)
VNPTSGELTPLSGFPVAVGIGPTIVTHDPQNRFLIVSDNSANLLHLFAIDSSSGVLTEVSPSPYITKIEPGTVITDPTGTHVYLYASGENGAYPGQGGNLIDAYNLSSTGVLTNVTGSPFATGSTSISMSAGIPAMVTDALGKFLYAQDNVNLYIFGIDSSSGALTLLQTIPGEFNSAIALDPAGTYLYQVGSNSILSYVIDPSSGRLSLSKSSPTALQPGGPYTITLSPSGQFAYTIENNNDLVSYSVNNGMFTPMGIVYTGVYGEQIAIDPSGSFVYVPQACSNCPSGLYNVVHEFTVGSNGTLTPLSSPTVAAGITPWGITLISQ